MILLLLPEALGLGPGREAVLNWIEPVQVVTEEILQLLVNTQDYLAVFFTGPCNKKALQEIGKVDLLTSFFGEIVLFRGLFSCPADLEDC